MTTTTTTPRKQGRPERTRRSAATAARRTAQRDTQRDARIELLLVLLDEAYQRKAWHGPNLRGAIRGLTPVQAGWRPATGRHSIIEIVAHAAYWKYIVRRRLLDEQRGSFPLVGSNWFAFPESPAPAAWRQVVALLEECHRRLRDAVAALPPASLDHTPPGRKTSNRFLVQGIAQHDVYHTGQIQLLKAWQRSR